MSLFDNYTFKHEEQQQSGPRRQYITEPGTHYLELADYDYLDGQFDEATGKNYKGKMGPAFTFVSVQSDAYAEGTRLNRMIDFSFVEDKPRSKADKDSHGNRLKAVQSEIGSVFVGLLEAAEIVKPGDDVPGEQIDAVMKDIDTVLTALKGKVVKCTAYHPKAKDGTMKGYTKEGFFTPYVNYRWTRDDR